jgi:PAS domain S-box-containing protein
LPLSWFEGILSDSVDGSEQARRLTSVLESLPIGIVLAKAPEGRIVYGNKSIERMLGHATFYSPNAASYDEWISFHEDGRRVEGHEYPLAKVLRGELNPELEVRYLRGDGSLIWIKITGAPLYDRNGKLSGAVVCVTDIEAVKMAEERERLMRLELSHRVNNALTNIQSIASLSLRFSRPLSDIRRSFFERVDLVSRIQVLLSQRTWTTIDIRELLSATIGDSTPGQIDASGDAVALRSDVALALGLAVYELMSNAEKFGALSNSSGRVTLSWKKIADSPQNQHILEWRERGGPSVCATISPGLGTMLLKEILPPQFFGSVSINFHPRGVCATMTFTP